VIDRRRKLMADGQGGLFANRSETATLFLKKLPSSFFLHSVMYGVPLHRSSATHLRVGHAQTSVTYRLLFSTISTMLLVIRYASNMWDIVESFSVFVLLFSQWLV